MKIKVVPYSFSTKLLAERSINFLIEFSMIIRFQRSTLVWKQKVHNLQSVYGAQNQ